VLGMLERKQRILQLFIVEKMKNRRNYAQEFKIVALSQYDEELGSNRA
jgi:hypothetical protein